MTSWSAIAEARSKLLAEEVIGIPTETVYGLAGIISSEKSLKSIFQLKSRPLFDPLIVHIGKFEQKDKLAKAWSRAEQILAEAFWPGPLTLITLKTDEVSDLITAGSPKVGIRMPSHPFTRRLLRSLPVPLAAPSANKFGKASPTCAKDVRLEFGGISLFVLDGGASDVGIESTVVEVEETASSILVQILRPGMITTSDLKRALEEKQSKTVQVVVKEKPMSPGHLAHHYQPAVPLIICSRHPNAEAVGNLENQFNIPRFSRFAELSLHPDPRLAARELYNQFRELPRSGAQWMYIRRTSERTGEHWQSLWNRIEKASSLVID